MQVHVTNFHRLSPFSHRHTNALILMYNKLTYNRHRIISFTYKLEFHRQINFISSFEERCRRLQVGNRRGQQKWSGPGSNRSRRVTDRNGWRNQRGQVVTLRTTFTERRNDRSLYSQWQRKLVKRYLEIRCAKLNLMETKVGSMAPTAQATRLVARHIVVRDS